MSRTVTLVTALPTASGWIARFVFSDGAIETATICDQPKKWMDAIDDLMIEVQDFRGTSWSNGEWTRTERGGIAWRAIEPTIVRVW
jgi:hypothetical protein